MNTFLGEINMKIDFRVSSSEIVIVGESIWITWWIYCGVGRGEVVQHRGRGFMHISDLEVEVSRLWFWSDKAAEERFHGWINV